jgi:hypothetical protein
MSKHKSTSHNIITLLIAVAILVMGFATFSGQVSPAYADNTPVTPTPSAIPTQLFIPDTGAKGQVAEMQMYFLAAFAQQLGTTTDKLSAAYLAAAGQTLDQAASVGFITKAQANDARGHLGDMDNYNLQILYLDQDPFPWDPYYLYQKYLMPEDLISALHSNGLNVITELKAGKSAADIAKENNLDIKAVQQAIMVSVTNRVSASASIGTLTTGQQNVTLTRINNSLPFILNRRLPASFFKDKDDTIDGDGR